MSALVKKELKELLMEKTILLGVLLMPLIIFPLLGGAMSIGFSASAEQIKQQRTLYIDLDGEEYSRALAELLKHAGIDLIGVTMPPNETRPQETMRQYGVSVMIVVPEDFTEMIQTDSRPTVLLYAAVEAPSIAEIQVISSAIKTVEGVGASLGGQIAKERGVGFEHFLSPFRLSETMIVRGQPIQERVDTLLQSYFGIMFTLPLVVLIVAGTSGSVAATSIGLEKESKTLEILLTLPISRMKILASKLVGSVLIALIGATSFTVGLTFYLTSFQHALPDVSRPPTSSANLPELLGLTPISVLAMGVTLVLGLLMALGLGILAGVLAGDVRGGQQLAGLLQFPPMILPFFLMLFTDFQALPPAVRYGLLLDPFTHIFLSLRASLTGDYLGVLASIGTMSLFVLLILGVAAWLFSGERLITMRIRLRKTTTE